MTAVLLSIKPEFAEKIFNGTKKYEFRKAIFKQPDIRKVIVYASSPVKKVIGEFLIDGILCDTVDVVWSETHQDAGITQQFYQSYYKNHNRAYAIKVGDTIKYKEFRDLTDYNIMTAPQSFTYIHVL